MKRCLLGILLLFFVIGSTNINVVSANSLSDDIYIDSTLSAKDKKALNEVMRGLDKEDRKNVVYLYEDGSFTANRPELIDEIKRQNANALDKDGKFKLKKVESDQNVSIASNKKSEQEVSILAYTNPSTACTAENPPHGPFRRVASTTGKSRITANIYLPSKSANEILITNSSNEKAHIYMGASTSAGTVDMGLALNYDAGNTPTMETWGVFIAGDTGNDGKFGNFKMGTEVFMKFYVVTSTSIALYVNGVNKAGTPTEITLTAQVSSSKNFNTSGSGMTVKRITSIAQTTEPTTPSGAYLYNVHWYNVKVGTTSGTEVLMDSTNTSVACGYKTTNVLVDYVSQSNEYIKLKSGTLVP